MAPRKEFQPSATGGEWRSVRSRGWRGRGARRAWTRSRIAALSGEEKVEDEGSVYGRRILEVGEGVN